jgi:hypothetical protein
MKAGILYHNSMRSDTCIGTGEITPVCPKVSLHQIMMYFQTHYIIIKYDSPTHKIPT